VREAELERATSKRNFPDLPDDVRFVVVAERIETGFSGVVVYGSSDQWCWKGQRIDSVLLSGDVLVEPKLNGSCDAVANQRAFAALNWLSLVRVAPAARLGRRHHHNNVPCARLNLQSTSSSPLDPLQPPGLCNHCAQCQNVSLEIKFPLSHRSSQPDTSCLTFYNRPIVLGSPQSFGSASRYGTHHASTASP
jgi:hypothetical protein